MSPAPARHVPTGVDRLPSGEDKGVAVRQMFDAIAGRYDLVNRVMTFRLDVRWRRRAVTALALDRGHRVADLACGTGDLCRDLATQGLRPVGFDFSGGMLQASTASCPLVQADVLDLAVPDSTFDGITCGFALRNFTDLERFWTETARILRPQGRVAVLEVAEPSSAILRFGHRFYFGSVVPRIGALLSDATAYRYLPKSVAYLPPPTELLEMIAAAGFTDVERIPLTGGVAQLITATRRG